MALAAQGVGVEGMDTKQIAIAATAGVKRPESVVELPVWKENMTPDDVLGHASRTDWKELLVLGYDSEGELISLNSGLKRSDALWLIEAEKRRVMEDG